MVAPVEVPVDEPPVVPVVPPLVAAPVEPAPFVELAAAVLEPVEVPLAAEVAAAELDAVLLDPEPPEQAANARPRPDKRMAREIKRCTVFNAAG